MQMFCNNSGSFCCFLFVDLAVSRNDRVTFLEALIELLWLYIILSKTRVLKSEVQEMEELEREKERYFASEMKEMEDFKAEVAKFSDESRREVQELENQAEQVCFDDILAILYVY